MEDRRSALHVVQIVEAASGGVGRHVRDLVQQLVGRGVGVSLFFGLSRSDAGFRAFATDLSSKGSIAVEVEMGTNLAGLFRAALAPRFIEKRLRVHAVRPDIIHGHSSVGGAVARLLARRMGLPVVYTPHAPIIMNDRLGLTKRTVYGVIERHLSRRTDLQIAVSHAELRLTREQGWRPRNSAVIYSAVPLITLGAAGRRPAVQDRLCRVVSVGRLSSQKDPILWRDVAASSDPKRFEFAWAGSGDLEGNLRAEGLPASARLLGHVDDVPALLGQADVLMMTSRYEGAPLALLEAMAAGLPVVCRSFAGAEEIVADGVTGFLVPSSRPADYVAALERLAASEDLRANMGDAAQDRVRANFLLATMVNRTLGVYSSLADNGSLGAPRLESEAPAGAGKHLTFGQAG